MVKYNDNARHIHRPIPCPAYDIYGTEAWLEDMARKGFLLARDGFFMGFADFEESRPCPMKYRLQPAKNPRSSFDEGEPEEAETELSEAMGWEYVARRGEFHIYRSADPAAPELNTDPVVQAMAIKAVNKRLPNHLVSIVLWLIVYPIFFFDAGIVRAAIATGSAFAIYSVLMLLWILSAELRAIAHLRTVRKRLEAGEAGPPSRWTQRSLRHISSRWLFVLAVIVWIAITVLMFLRVGSAEKPNAEFEGEVPFATLAEIYPNAADYTAISYYDGANCHEYVSDPLISPVSIIWHENASLTAPDGSSLGGILSVYYHEMSSPLLAKIVAWEFEREAKGSKYYEPAELPDLGVDYAAAYYDFYAKVLVREGSVVMEARFLPDPDSFSMADWAQIMADSIKEAG